MPPSEMVSFRLPSVTRELITQARGETRESDWMREAVAEKLARTSPSTDGDAPASPRFDTINRTEAFRRAAEVAAKRRTST